MKEDQREMLRLVSRATFANPFGEERWALDARVAQADPHAEDIVNRMVERVRAMLQELGEPTAAYASARDPGDNELVEHAVLFDAFHRFADDFDALIRRQRRSEAPVPFDAHERVRAFLVANGWPPTRVGRVLELFYQLRRAFLLIRDSLVGTSASMRALREALWNQLFTHDVRRYEQHLWNRMEDFSLILLGETGAGKGAAAAALGGACFIAWDEAHGAFTESFTRMEIPLNLSEVPGTLLESALFGHEKGAFTGAIRRVEGALARCPAHGVLFLDEIGEVPPAVQVKLLRVLQERTFTPLGSERSERFRGRVIAATHRPLEELRAGGCFRDDFYYRLCSDVVVVPPLRQRLAEDPSELMPLLRTLADRIGGSATLATTVMEAIERDLPRDYGWPGNVRELEQTVRRVLITGRCALPQPQPSGDVFGAARAGNLSARELLELYCAQLYERFGTYEGVAQRTGLDRRTVKKHIIAHRAS